MLARNTAAQGARQRLFVHPHSSTPPTIIDHGHLSAANKALPSRRGHSTAGLSTHHFSEATRDSTYESTCVHVCIAYIECDDNTDDRTRRAATTRRVRLATAAGGCSSVLCADDRTTPIVPPRRRACRAPPSAHSRRIGCAVRDSKANLRSKPRPLRFVDFCILSAQQCYDSSWLFSPHQETGRGATVSWITRKTISIFLHL